MKMSDEQIQAVASMLTDDPDMIVNEGVVTEWWGSNQKLSPLQQKLASVTGVKDPTRLQALEQELQQFIQYRPTLKAKGEEQALQAFIHYKKTGKMPANPGLPQNLDQMGGRDFRGENKGTRKPMIT